MATTRDDDTLYRYDDDATPATWGLVSVVQLLRDASALVDDQARTKQLAVVVVPVDEHVFVPRARIVTIVSALLRRAVTAAPPRGRVAVTAQQFERDLVFAVYDTGPRATSSRRLDDVTVADAGMLGGRVWTAPAPKGNLVLFSMPLYDLCN